MGANSSSISDLPKNEYLKKLSGTESISENDPFWNQLFSFSFPAPTSSTELKLLEEATVSVCKSLVENNPRTGNLGALTKVFLSRTRELRLSAECQNHIFIWQTHNALFIICCLLKVFICEMSEEELQLHFMYEEKSPGSYSSNSEDLLEELLCSLVQLITDTPLLKDDSIILLLEPAHGLLFADSVFGPNAACSALLVCDAETWPTQHHIEVQAVDPNAWVVFDAQINMFLNPKAKVSSI